MTDALDFLKIPENAANAVVTPGTCSTPEVRVYFSNKDKDCWYDDYAAITPTFTDFNCPAGWKYTGKVENPGKYGCNFAHSLPTCTIEKFSKSNAECCLKSNGETQCKTGFCIAKQNGSDCQTALEAHCKDNFQKGGVLSAECWEWAKKNWTQGITNYCSQGSSGSLVVSDDNCRAWANNPESHGKFDEAITKYCTKSPLAQSRAKNQGETICNCFKEFLPDDPALQAIGDNNLAACWYVPCTQNGYRTQAMIDRSQNCGSFCAQILSNVDITARGDVKIPQDCPTDAKSGAGVGGNIQKTTGSTTGTPSRDVLSNQLESLQNAQKAFQDQANAAKAFANSFPAGTSFDAQRNAQNALAAQSQASADAITPQIDSKKAEIKKIDDAKAEVLKGDSTSSSSSIPWLWIGLGIGALVLLIIIIVAIVAANKRKQQNQSMFGQPLQTPFGQPLSPPPQFQSYFR